MIIVSINLLNATYSQTQESPRWLASVGRNGEALRNLAYLRSESTDSGNVLHEMAEIEAQIEE